jgi:lycopene cyclase domain-containing protein
MHGLYLAGLCVALAGVIVLDVRLRLFVRRDARAAVAGLVGGVAVFTAWDLTGIGAGVFFRGVGPYQSGILLAPEYPLEELVFLTLLCWTTGVLQGLIAHWLPALLRERAARRSG